MSNYYHHQQQQPYYDYEPQQGYYQHDGYAMHTMAHQQQQPTYHNDSDYYSHPVYDPKPTSATDDGYLTPTTLTKHQRLSEIKAELNNEKYSRTSRNSREHSSCCDKLCCGCCTCCPRWYRWISCCLLLIIIALGIVVGVLAALFKTPTVEFTGVQDNPNFNLTGTSANLNLVLGFTVNNPNIESVTFKTLVATATYHGDNTKIGGGTLNDLHIGSNSVTNFTFPFDISMNLLATETQLVASKIMSDCGIGGGTAQDIQLDYKVVATVSIIGIPISVPYSSTISFKCPIDSADQSSLLNEIASLLQGFLNGGQSTNGKSVADTVGSVASNAASALGDSSIPTDIANLVPSGLASSIASLTGGQ
ncbi:MAG: hypothetical protein EXX96DRAFT_580594 [Benjaminiella poitrasii]|nr:MAG: hypothetical protein EXX96DRAFT_580594 [Benjaminiella poitrasii]